MGATIPSRQHVFAQSGFEVRFEWGRDGLDAVRSGAAAVVIVDVLSFTTAVEVATARGARVFPFGGSAADARRFASTVGAVLAERRGSGGSMLSLSPASLIEIEAGTDLVLPSPNGSALAQAAGELQLPVFAGCLRNASAVAAAAADRGGPVAVIAAGERRHGLGTLRPALEDLLGAGAIVSALPGTRSPEATAAAAAFAAMRHELAGSLAACASGRELVEMGFAEDVAIAARLDVATTAPRLTALAFSA